MKNGKICNHNRKRACLKILFILGVAAAIVLALSFYVPDQALDELKYSLTLGSIVAIVIIINVISFVCFLIFSMAYHWVRQDLKPPRTEDVLDDA